MLVVGQRLCSARRWAAWVGSCASGGALAPRATVTPSPMCPLTAMLALVLAAGHQEPLPFCPAAFCIYLLSTIKHPVPLQLSGAFFGSGSLSGCMEMHGVDGGFGCFAECPLKEAVGCLCLAPGQGSMAVSSPEKSLALSCLQLPPGHSGCSGSLFLRLWVSSSCSVPSSGAGGGDWVHVPPIAAVLCSLRQG